MAGHLVAYTKVRHQRGPAFAAAARQPRVKVRRFVIREPAPLHTSRYRVSAPTP